MEIEMYQTVSNDWVVNDAVEDAPLAKVQFCNELRELPLEDQLHLMYEFKLAIINALNKR